MNECNAWLEDASSLIEWEFLSFSLLSEAKDEPELTAGTPCTVNSFVKRNLSRSFGSNIFKLLKCTAKEA